MSSILRSFVKTSVFLILCTLLLPTTSSLIPAFAEPNNTTLSIQAETKPSTADHYSAVFSYTNTTGKGINIQIGENNNIAPGDKNQNKGQTTQFQTGTVTRAFVIEIKCEEKITWTIIWKGETKQAIAEAGKCGYVPQNATLDQQSAVCLDPTKGIPIPEQTDEISNSFYLPINASVPASATPQSSPDLFKKVTCLSNGPINYKQGDTFSPINNAIKTDNSKNEYAYSNTGGVIKTYFPQNPNNGFLYISEKKQEFQVKKVSINGKNLEWDNAKVPVIKNDTITYVNVLPGIDLQYKVTNTALAKYLIISSLEAAKKNAIDKFSLEMTSLEVKKESQATNVIDAQDFKNTKQKNVRDISNILEKQANLLDQKISNSGKNNGEETQKVEQKDALNANRIKNQKKKTDKLKQDLDQGKITLEKTEEEIKKIQNLADISDTLVLKNTGNNSIKLARPITYSKTTLGEKIESFAVSEDGKTIDIYPDQDYLLNPETKYPVIIDPQINDYYDTRQDAFVTQWYPDSNRGSNNPFMLAVGNNPCIYVGYWTGQGGSNGSDCNYGYWMGRSRILMQFGLPTGALQNPGAIQNVQMVLRQYTQNGGGYNGFVDSLCGGFDEWSVTWNSSPGGCAYYARSSVYGPGQSYSCGGSCWPGTVSNYWTDNIAQLARDQFGQGYMNFRINMDEGQWEWNAAAGSLFCSKDHTRAGHPCEPGWTSPLIFITYNNPPPSPVADGVKSNSERDYLSQNDFVSGCDMSINDNRCTRTPNVQYNVANVRDPDEGCNRVNVRINQYTNFREWSQSQNTSWYTVYGPGYGVTGAVNSDTLQNNGDCTYRRLDAANQNGEITWLARNEDGDGANSSWSNIKRFLLDSSAPVKVNNQKTTTPYSTPQPTISLPQVADNSIDKITINHDPVLGNFSTIQYAGDTTKVVTAPNTLTGSRAVLNTYNPSDSLHQFRASMLNGKQVFRVNGDQSKCLSLNDNSTVTLEPCNESNPQNLVLDELGRITSSINNSSPLLCLELVNADTTNGSSLAAKTCSDTSRAQKWIVYRPQVSGNGGNGDSTVPLNIPWQLYFNGNTRDPNNNWGPDKLILANPINVLSEQFVWESNGNVRGVDGACLDVWGGNIAGKSVGYGPCHNGSNQKFDYTDKGQIRIRNENLCLDTGTNIAGWGGYLTAQTCSNIFSQKFIINKLPTTTFPLFDQSGNWISSTPATSNIFSLDLSYVPNKSIDGGGFVPGGNAYIWDSNNSPAQQFVYTNEKKIKPYNNQNLCLDTWGNVGTALLFTNCHNNNSSQRWTFEKDGSIKSVLYTNMCIDLGYINTSNGNSLLYIPCNNTNAQHWNLRFLNNIQNTRIWEYPNLGLVYEVRYQKNGWDVNKWCATGALNSPSLKLPNNTNCSGADSQFNAGDVITIQYRARDRINGTYNISQWYDGGKTIITTNDIQYINNSLVIRPYDGSASPTDTNAIDAMDKRFSPNNATSSGKKDAISIKYQFQTKYLRLAGLVIKNAAGNTIAQINRCRMNNTAEAPCNESNSAYTPNSANTVEYIWDGKKSDGTQATDGRYEVQPVILGATCQSDNLNKLNATDAGFTGSYGDSDRCYYNNELTGDDRYVVVDNTGANIGISTPAYNTWVNKPNYQIKGGVAGYNNTALEDRDAQRLEICQLSGTTCTYQNIIFDSNKNWSYTPTLTRGLNEFQLRSTDLAWNTITKIGNPNDTAANANDAKNFNDELQTSWKINFEADNPTITSIAPATGSDPTFRSPKLEIKIQDTNPGNSVNFVSGLNTRINPIGYDISLLRKYASTDTTWQEIPLYKDGVNLTDNTTRDTDRILKTFSCTSQVATTDSIICTLELTNLQLDGLYQVYVRARDKAGNQACSKQYTEIRDIKCSGSDTILTTLDYGFEVKTNTYQAITSPTTTSLQTANTTYTIAGNSEKSRSTIQQTKVRITNAALDNGAGRYLEFIVDPAKNGVLPAEYNATTNALIAAENIDSTARLLTNIARKLTLTCSGATVNHDQNTATPNIAICTWSIKISLQPNTVAGTLQSNQISIITSDWMKNESRFASNFAIDTSQFEIATRANLGVFSPDGDGNFDTITFTNTATNSNSTALSNITSSRIEIRNPSNQLVYSMGNPGGLLATQVWDGSSNQGGITPGDGLHSVVFIINRTIGGIVTTTTSPTITILRKTQFNGTDATVLFTPTDGYVTNRGSITIQGQGIKSSYNNIYYIDICIKTMNIGETDASTYNPSTQCPAGSLVSTQTDMNTGFFSVIGNLKVTTRQKYKIIAKVRAFANSTSTPKIITTDTGTLFQGASVQVDLNGVNSLSDLQSYTNLTNSAITPMPSSLKVMQLRAIVARDTEAVDIDWGYYDNNQTIPANYNNLFSDNNRIATINNTVEPVGKYNPTNPGLATLRADLAGTYRKDATTTNNKAIRNFADLNNITKADADIYYIDPSNATSLASNTTNNVTTLRANKCNQDQCEWLFLYPYPNWLSGGQYDIRFRAYRGDLTSEVTVPVIVNGQIRTAPKLLQVNRQQGIQWLNTLSTNNNDTALTKNFFTNSPLSRLFIGGEADTKYTFKLKAFDSNNTQLGTTYTLQNATDSTAKKTGTNGVIGFDIDFKNLPGIPTGDKKLVLYYLDANGAEVNAGSLVLDTTAPQIDWVQTNTNKPYLFPCVNAGAYCNLQAEPGNQRAIDPWVGAGNAVQYYIRTSEPTQTAVVINENSIFETASKVFTGTSLPCATKFSQENYRVANAGSITDPCMDSYRLARESVAVMTITNPNDTYEGALVNHIFLKDLAGNTTILSNIKTKLDQYVALSTTPDEYKNAQRFDAKYDTSFLIDSDGQSNINRTNKTLIKAVGSQTAGSALTADQLRFVTADAATGRQALPTSYPYTVNAATVTLPNGQSVLTGRGKSLDFRIFADITLPTRTDSFKLLNWGTAQKVKDTVCTDSSGIILAADTTAVTKPCAILTDSVGQNISTINNQGAIADGVNADGVTPEQDRLNASGTSYVIRGNKVLLRAPVEKNQRMILNVIKTDRRTQSAVTSSLFPTNSQVNCAANPLLPAGTYTGTNASGDKLRNGLITLFQQRCDGVFDYTLSDDGAQDASGTAWNTYSFTMYPVDNAGNVPTNLGGPVSNGGNGTGTQGQNTGIRSGSVLVYHDTAVPVTANLTLLQSNSSASIAGDDSTDPLTRRITNDTGITVTQLGELNADYVSSLSVQKNSVVSGTTTPVTSFDINNNPKNVIRNTSNAPYSQNNYRVTKGGEETNTQGQVIANLADQMQAKTSYILGNTGTNNSANTYTPTDTTRTIRDDARAGTDSCITTSNSPIANRRIGVCNDGVYTVNTQVIDTAGNRNTTVSKKIERDTVGPANPIVTLSKSGDPQYGEFLGINITGEALTQVTIIVNKPDGTRFVGTPKLSNTGTWSSSNLLGAEIQCGSIQYTAQVNLLDRAGNTSNVTISNTITSSSTCYHCGYVGTGAFALPVDSSSEPDYDDFPNYRSGGYHDGHDFAVANGTSIKAVEAGTVFKVISNKTDNYGWADGQKGPYTTYDSYLGNYIVINHNNGIYSIYGHLSSVNVSVGANITKSQIIGKAGSTGNSDGFHLHFQLEEVDQNTYGRSGMPEVPGNVQNPLKYFSTKPSNYTDPIAQQAKCVAATPTGGQIEDINEDDVRITQLEANQDAAKFILTKLSNDSVIERNAISGVYWDTSKAGQDNISVPPVVSNPKLGELFSKDKLTKNNLAAAVTDYNIKFGTAYSSTDQSLDLAKNGMYRWLVYHFVDAYQYAPKVYIHHLAENGLQGEAGHTGYDGAIILNPYNRYLNTNRGQSLDTAFLIKNGIWEKWYNNGDNTTAKVVGTPQAIEENYAPSEWQQFFRKSNYTQNLIDFWKFDGVCPGACGNNTSVHFIVNEIAKQFLSNRSKYQLPNEDTQSTEQDLYCKQDFTGGPIDNCNNFSTDTIIRDGATYQINYEVSLRGPNLMSAYMDNNSKVWILLHGWNDSNAGPVCKLSAQIQQQDPTATTICVDWSSMANQGRWLEAVANLGPQYEADFIAEVASKVVENLNIWKKDYNLKDNLYIIGHSLGSILGAQISSNLGGAKYLLALDPPGKNYNGSYYIINGKEFSTFQNDENRGFTKAQFVRSLVSQRTWADNPILASTTDESILVEYATMQGPKDKHSGWNKSGLLSYLNTNTAPFVNINTKFGYYSSNNNLSKGKQKSDYNQNYSGLIRANNNKPDYLQVASDGGIPGNNYTLYGTNGSDEFTNDQFSSAQSFTIYGGNGSDKILTTVGTTDGYNNYTIMSWNAENRIRFKDAIIAKIACNPNDLGGGIYTNELKCNTNSGMIKINGVSASDLRLKWNAFKNPTTVPSSNNDPRIAQTLVGSNNWAIFE